MPDPLQLVRVPLRVDHLVGFARGRGLSVREMDEGYVAHVVMRELWGEEAPAPFVLHGRGRVVEAWGYSYAPASRLVQLASSHRDTALASVVDELADVASKAVPILHPGRRVGFTVRACPVVRLGGPRNGHRKGAEVDAFLARSFAVGKDVHVDREAVYREWLLRLLSRPEVTGVEALTVRVRAMSRERLLRRTHEPAARRGHQLERPEVRYEGVMRVTDGERLLACLAHGIGRHRAFGFGALMLTHPDHGTLSTC